MISGRFDGVHEISVFEIRLYQLALRKVPKRLQLVDNEKLVESLLDSPHLPSEK